MKTELKRITPALAADWLANTNYQNRPLMKSNVRYLVQQIKEGRFQTTHQGIAFTKEGRLLDGQHRLAAIVESGTAVEMLVFTDVDKEAYLCIDQGKRKSSSDVFGCSKQAAHVARLACYVLSGNNNPDQNFVGRMLAIVSDGTDALERRSIATAKTLTSSPIRLAAVVRLLDNEDRAWVLQTWDDLANVRIDRLPASAQSLVSQAIRGHAGARHSKLDLLARGITVFSRDKIGVGRVIVRDVSTARDYVRSVLSRYAHFSIAEITGDVK